MTSRRIDDPLAGERLLAVVPAPGAEAESGPRRLNLFSGRALSDGALRAEQAHRQERLWRLAQLRGAGVVNGLEVKEEQPSTAERWLHVTAGVGLSATGGDVWLPRPLRLRFADLPRLDLPPATPEEALEREAQRLWVLVVRPVSVLQADAADPNRCSEWDDSGRAFEAETRRDGSLLGKVPVGDLLPQEGGGRWLATLNGHQGPVSAVGWSPGGAWLASAGADGLLRLWNAETPTFSDPLAAIKAHSGGVHALSWRPDGAVLASGGDDGVVRLWTARGGSDWHPRAEFEAQKGAVHCLSWRPDGAVLASGGEDGVVRLWRQGEERLWQAFTSFEAHDRIVHSLSWSPDGTRLASAGEERQLRLWSIEGEKDPRREELADVLSSDRLAKEGGWRLLASLTGSKGEVWSLSWSPDGTRLAGAGEDGCVRLWRGDAVERSEPLVEVQAHPGGVSSVRWSPDGSQLASAGADGDVRLWAWRRRAGLDLVAVLAGHDGRATSVGWSPDGQRLASGGREGTVRLWGVTNLEERERWRNELAHALLTLEQEAREAGHPVPWETAGLPIALVALSPDRRSIAFVDGAAVARLGGAAREGTPLLPGRLPASLVRARLRQFAEQMAELPPSGASSPAEEESWMRTVVTPAFRHLPPFGLLPRAALGDLQLSPRLSDGEATPPSLTTTECRFFPGRWHVHLAPIPQEQLELALRDAAQLAPFDLDQADQVQLWVPVPQAWYEPDLLLEEAVPAVFTDKLKQFTAIRDTWLRRRGWLRRRLAAITRDISGKPASFPVPDPGQLDPKEPEESTNADADDPVNLQNPEEEEYGTVVFNGQRRGERTNDLRVVLEKDSPIDNDAVVLLTRMDQSGKERLKLSLEDIQSIQQGLSLASPQERGKFSYDHSTGLLTVHGVMSGAEKEKLVASFSPNLFDPDEIIPTLNSLYESSQDNTVLAALDVQAEAFKGLELLIDLLQAKTAEADDSIEFGFLQTRTNMYRIRQQVMGQEDAMRLAVSPTLAAIATRETARAVQADLKTYFQQIKKAQPSTTSGTTLPRAAGVVASGMDSSPEEAPAPDEPFDEEGAPQGRAFSQLNMLTTDSGRASWAVGGLERDASLFQSKVSAGRQGMEWSQMNDVLEQSPLQGMVSQSISVGERLSEAAAITSRNFVIDDRVSVLGSMRRQGIFKDLQVPGQANLTFGLLAPGGGNLTLEPPKKDADEVTYFSSAVQTLDLMVAALRLGEGRLRQYRLAITRCQETLQELKRQRGRLEERLRVVDTALAEARQDVSIASALLAEELARVNRINERRRRILRDHVPCLAFQRPRTLELRQAPPWRPLDPGPSASPLPPCLNDDAPIPREVRAMVDLLREAPLGWFQVLLPELRRMDRIDTLVRVFSGAALRRGVIAPTAPQPLQASEGGETPIGRTINRLFSQRQQLLRQSWLGVSPQVPQAVASQSWRESLRQAERFLTLGDLLAGDHHRPELSNLAAALQERWCRVATCLKERFGAIEPRLRLDWAERLSQFDGPVNLRLLTNLPRWGEVPDVRQRRALQSLVDWLFQQVNSAEEPALAFVNDLVRLSLLLACHAPVNQILSGQVIGTRSLAPEARLPIRMDPLRVRIGMPVLFHSASGVVAEGLVEDLSGDVATARILRGNASLSADAQTRVQFLRQPLL